MKSTVSSTSAGARLIECSETLIFPSTGSATNLQAIDESIAGNSQAILLFASEGVMAETLIRHTFIIQTSNSPEPYSPPVEALPPPPSTVCSTSAATPIHSLASDLQREYDGVCVQMRMSYSAAAQFLLFFVQWADCHLAGALGLLRILIYKTRQTALFSATQTKKGYSRTRDLESEEVLEQLPSLKWLLYRLLGCMSFKIYCANDGIINLIDKMPRHETIKARDIYRRAGQQVKWVKKS
ncbi:hypothetical protein L1987_59839 [Smallanthus sonchifolius]|uniref:Uncharacterized protein n=1 Tax=Smallanthus sonchifolius TaxID=185202 RepID=A0ACB9D6E3_9ASTR|nr:hypothetical protein L1987_59839 [Smallanthus sonchifolius]